MKKRARRPFRILALAGGGYLGLYTASVLAELEAWAGEPLGRRFDLIAGTSVGGMLALGVAYELPMNELRDLFLAQGRSIFSPRALPSRTVTRLLDLTRSVLGPKYRDIALRAVLAEALGARTLGDALHPVVIPAVDVTHGRTKVFKTPHAPASSGDGHVAAVDVALATAAAPAYFPSVRIGDALYADGGLFAVAPDLVALHEAEHFLGVRAADVTMLSIGTATSGYTPDGGAAPRDGAVGWLSGGRLVLTLIAAQQQHVEAVMEDRLGDRYVRLDAPWTPGARIGIDVATSRAAALLRASAERTIATLDRADFERRFGARAAPA